MKMIVYDPSGVAHTVEAVDGREYLKSGHYTSEPPATEGGCEAGAAGETELTEAPQAHTVEAVDGEQAEASTETHEELVLGKPGRKAKAKV